MNFTEAQIRNCQRKRGFRLKVHAEVHALQATNWRRNLDGSIKIHAYLCPVCSQYHLSRRDPATWKP